MGENKAPDLSTYSLVYSELVLLLIKLLNMAHNASKFNQPCQSFLLQTIRSLQPKHLILQGAGNLVEA